ncbi:polo like kinase SAK [Arctopsyche grandis]|uniref:polo like kinase SAK n=1 Tax=Arctopsyche grandis TaxID=121162 RepID=UPI00406D6F8D
MTDGMRAAAPQIASHSPSPSPSTATSIGDRIEDYHVAELLGSGGFAQVYRAQCRRSRLHVAIKMIDKARMNSAGMADRVRQEVAIHSRLKHPSILELYTFFEDAHYVYLVLELAHNGSLASRFRLDAIGMSEEDSANILRQVVDGVLYLHSHRILHRDLSVNNLLVTKEQRVKIADFGLATQLNEPNEKHMTMCGTPNYISPEVASRSQHGLPADVWGLGCLLYMLLVGKPPFDTNHVKHTLNRVIQADYHMPQGLSREAQDLLDRLLRKNPAERIPLNQLACHPFLTKYSTFGSNNSKREDSGFHTSLHTTQSTQHHRTRFGDRLTSAFIPMLQRVNSVDRFDAPIVRPKEITGSQQNLYTPDNPSNCNMHDYGHIQSTAQHDLHFDHCDSNMETSEANYCKSKPQQKDCFNNIDERNPIPVQENLGNASNKENIIPGTRSIGVPPLCAVRLAKTTHQTRNAKFTISANGSVTVLFIKKRGHLREDRITEVCVVSKDGMQVIIYTVDGGKGCPVSSPLPPYTSLPQDTFTYHNLPEKHWKKYLYAARFVDMVKAKTPKITVYSSEAKCHLMENRTDFEGFFYNGVHVKVTAVDGVKIVDQNGKTHRDVKNLETCVNQIYTHFQECMNWCLEVESLLEGASKDSYPLVIGRRPKAPQSSMLVSRISQQCTPNLANGGSIGSFYNATGSATSRTDTAEFGGVLSFGAGQLRAFNPLGERNVPFKSSSNNILTNSALRSKFNPQYAGDLQR